MDGEFFTKYLIGLFIDSTGGYLLENILERVQNMNKDVQNDILKCINKALKRSLENIDGIQWRKNELLNYIKNNNFTIEKIEETRLEDLIVEIYSGSQEFNLPNNWEREFSKICIDEFSQNQNVSNYLLLMNAYYQRDKITKQEEQRYNEYKNLSYRIQYNFTISKQEDLYEGINFINNTFYPYFCDLAVEGCSQELLGIGYWLANIYDYTSDYEKSVKISHVLLNSFLKDKSKIDKFYLQKLIGCTYTLGVAKIDNLEKKDEYIKEAFDLFTRIDQMIDNWVYKSNSDYLYIMGLYYSDYAACLVNMYDWVFKNNKIDEKVYLESCKVALEIHKVGAKYRENLLELDLPKSNDNIINLYQSKSNIAGVYYRLKKYQCSINKHKEVLRYWQDINDKTRIMLSKTYIIGNYIELWNFINIDEETLAECTIFLEECQEYYRERDSMRYEDINKKSCELREIINKLSVEQSVI